MILALFGLPEDQRVWMAAGTSAARTAAKGLICSFLLALDRTSSAAALTHDHRTPLAGAAEAAAVVPRQHRICWNIAVDGDLGLLEGGT